MKPLSTLIVAELRSLREECPHRATEINEELRNRCENIIAMNYPLHLQWLLPWDETQQLEAMRRDFAS